MLNRYQHSFFVCPSWVSRRSKLASSCYLFFLFPLIFPNFAPFFPISLHFARFCLIWPCFAILCPNLPHLPYFTLFLSFLLLFPLFSHFPTFFSIFFFYPLLPSVSLFLFLFFLTNEYFIASCPRGREYNIIYTPATNVSPNNNN